MDHWVNQFINKYVSNQSINHWIEGAIIQSVNNEIVESLNH